jgi:hypothetical protein
VISWRALAKCLPRSTRTGDAAGRGVVMSALASGSSAGDLGALVGDIDIALESELCCSTTFVGTIHGTSTDSLTASRAAAMHKSGSLD